MSRPADRSAAAATPAVSFRDFVRDLDLPTLRRWLDHPHVARWWGEPGPVLEEASTRDADSQAIVLAAGREAGYICWQTPSREELVEAGVMDPPPGLVDVDLLIGEADLMGRGIGPAAVLLLAERLRSGGTITHLGVGMSLDNRRSVGAAARVGFRRVSVFDDPRSGRGCYMILDLERRCREGGPEA